MTRTDEWIDVVRRLDEDPKAEVYCPRCGRESLQVIDTPIDDETIERHLMCALCNAYNAVRMKKPSRDGSPR